MQASPMQWVAAGLFAAALVHTFATKALQRLAHRHHRHAGAFHLLGEVEVVFGLGAGVLIVAMALMGGGAAAIDYAESRQFAEPLFVFVVMVIAASLPVLSTVASLMSGLARWLPLPGALAQVGLGLAAVPLLGSLITEPAAMTLNVSIDGTLTSYAAPPVLMVAGAWLWGGSFMFTTFGWKAAIAVLVNATAVSWLLRRRIKPETLEGRPPQRVPGAIQLIHMKASCRCGTTGDSPAPFTPRRVLKAPEVSGDPAISQERFPRDTNGFNFRLRRTYFSNDRLA